MVKAREKRTKREKLTRKQRRAMDKTSFGDPENLDAQLKNLGLCTKNITGDGNCLFRSLSDQYFGHDGNHKAVRQEVCQYLRENEETYKFFVEDDQPFEHHVELMAQDATFGGNMELAAFAKLKKVDIKVYQPGMIYVINGDDDEIEKSEEEVEPRQTLHIAYHSWEHYSSVRNIDGPYSGPPEIKVIEQSLDQNDNTKKEDENEEDKNEELSSKEKVVRSACPDASIRKIRRLLIKYKGDPDKVIDAIYESESKDVNNEPTNEPTKEDTAMANVLDEMSVTVQGLLEAISTETPAQDEQTIEANDDSLSTGDQQNTSDQTPKDILPDEIMEEKEPHDQQESPSEALSPPPIKRKKLSAAERKKEQKKRQKENKLMKDRAKAARKAGYKQQAKLKDDQEQDAASDVVGASQSMKEMYI